MDEIQHFHVYKGSTPGSVTGSWQTQLSISGASLTANSRYLVMARGSFQNQDSAGTKKIQHRVLGGGVEIVGSFGSRGFTSGGAYAGYQMVSVMNTGSVPVDIEFQVQSDTAFPPATFRDNYQLFAMLLTNDLIENVDWAFGEENVNEVVSNTVWETKASITFNADQAANWLILGQMRTVQPAATNVDGIKYRTSLDSATVGSNSQPAETLARNENANSVDDEHIDRLMRVYPALPSGSHTINLQFQSVSANTNLQYDGCNLFALNIDRFLDVVVDFTGASQGVSSQVELINKSVTPTVADSNFMMLFGATTQNAGFNIIPSIHMQLDDVQIDSDPVGAGDDNDVPVESFQGGYPFYGLSVFPLAAGLRNTDVDLSIVGLARNLSQRSFALFSLELKQVRKVQGTVLENGLAVSRTVVAYRAVAPYEKLGEAISDAGTGAFSISNLPIDNVNVVALDDAAGDSFNALIFGNVTPVAI